VPVTYCERLRRETPSMAGGAAHFHIGHEMQLDGEHTRALTTLTAPARDVKRKLPRRILEPARLRRSGKGFTDGCKRIRIRRGVRTRDTPDMLLVDGDDLVEIFIAFDGIVISRSLAGVVEMFAERAIQNVEHQRRLS